MEILKASVKELVGLFVDDGSLAVAILAVVAASAWTALRLEANSSAALLLVFGCVAVLAENVLRAARRQRD